MQLREDIYDYHAARNERAEANDNFLLAFGGKHGSNKRFERRKRKGYRNGDEH